MSLRDAAKYLGIAPSTLLAYIDAGTGPRGKVTSTPTGGRRFQFTRRSLDAWQKHRTTTTGATA